MSYIAAFTSLFLPGVGQALLGRTRRGVLWALAGIAVMPTLLLSPWMLIGFVVVRLGAAVDAVRLRRDGGPAIRIAVMLGIASILAWLGHRIEVIESYRVPSSSMAPTLRIGDRFFVDKLTPRWRPVARGEVVAFHDPTAPDRTLVKRVVALAGDGVAIRRGILFINDQPVPQRMLGSIRLDDLDPETGAARTLDATLMEERVGERRYQVLAHPEEVRVAKPGEEPRLPSATVAFRHDYPLRLGDDLTPRCGDPTPDRPSMAFTEDHLSCRVPPGSFFVLADNRMSLQDSRIWGAVGGELLIGRVLSIWWSENGGQLDRVGTVE